MQGEVDSNQYGRSFTRSLQGNLYGSTGVGFLRKGGIFGIVNVNVSFLARLLI